MKTYLIILFSLLATLGFGKKTSTLLVEAENFDIKGGWVVDQQFMNVMGSPFLMAHGLGNPVKDAKTTLNVPAKGNYDIYVRTRNWASTWTNEAPGVFKISINGKEIDHQFGAATDQWTWEKVSDVNINSKKLTLALHDLTGFNGRCDAIIITNDKGFIAPKSINELKKFRANNIPEQKKIKKAGSYDLVIIGGGMPGVCMAISAARLGVNVALIQNRPVLGGNNSSEVRVHLGARINQKPYPRLGDIVNEIGPTKGGNARPENYYEDDKKLKAVLAEKNISLFLNYHANEVTTANNQITEVVAENIETGKKLRFAGTLFADCTGDGIIGAMAGAEFMEGRESRSAYNEPEAPVRADSLTMGASVQWFSKKENKPAPFPQIKWGLPWNEEKAEVITRGDWQWETGMGLDMEQDFEHIRDYGLLAVFSNWSYIKNAPATKEKLSNQKLKWVAFVAGKRESRRLKGDIVLTQNDIETPKIYKDKTCTATWSLDLHYPDPKNEKLFPGAPFKSYAKHIRIKPYPIPYRCFYSKNVNNLFMAGRNISVSHVALGTVRLMRTGGMMGEVLGMAASICKKEKALPRDVYEKYLDQLIELMKIGVGDSKRERTQNYNG